MRPHPPPALPSSPSQRKIPLGRARPPARLGWAVWHDAQCRGGGPSEESRLRGTASRGEEAVGTGPQRAEPRCQIAATGSGHPTPGAGHPGTRRLCGAKGDTGHPTATAASPSPPRGSAGVWGCAPPPPKGLPALPTRLPPTSYRPRAWRAYACTPTCVRCTHARRLSWVRTRVHSVQPCPQVRARVCAHTHPLIFSARRL